MSDALEAGMACSTNARPREAGTVGTVLAWIIGIPLPILLAIYIVRAC